MKPVTVKEKTSSSLNLHFEGLVRLFGYLVCSLIATARHSYLGLPLIDPQCAEIRSVVVLSLRFNLFFFLPSFLPPPPFFLFFSFWIPGHVSLGDNHANGYKSRELKSVHIDVVARYVRVLAMKCHVNVHNNYNQV